MSASYLDLHVFWHSLVTVTIQVINSATFKEYLLEVTISFCFSPTILCGLKPTMFFRSQGAHVLFHYNFREK